MRFLLIIPLVFLTMLANGQAKKSSHHNTIPPAYFLDSVRVSVVPVFDINKIESLNAIDGGIYDEATKTKGKVFIATKKNTKFSFLTLEQVAAKFAKNKGPYLYILDNQIIKEIIDYKIDSSYILKCEIIEKSELPYLQNSCPLTVLNILTRSKVNLDNENKIYIRGTATSFLKENDY